MQGPAGQLVSMIQSSVMICRAQTKVTQLSIDRLVLSGGTARMKGIKEYFQANMSVPVEVFDPASDLDLSALPEEDQAELGETPADFAVAVGLAETLLASQAFRLEVLTEKEKKWSATWGPRSRRCAPPTWASRGSSRRRGTSTTGRSRR
jgi:cell division ATPase FtsA